MRPRKVQPACVGHRRALAAAQGLGQPGRLGGAPAIAAVEGYRGNAFLEQPARVAQDCVPTEAHVAVFVWEIEAVRKPPAELGKREGGRVQARLVQGTMSW